MNSSRLTGVLCCCWIFVNSATAADSLKLATFDVDASPPIGSPLAYDPTKEVESPLSCRGVVLLGAGKPIVLCAVDWIGIGNGSHRHFRESLAQAADTTPDRVAVHALHQHDAPRCDFTVDELLDDAKVNANRYDSVFGRDVILRAARAAKACLSEAKPVTHLGLGQAQIDKVASNRRILGEDGKVQYMRLTATRDPKIRAMPVGTIDPILKMISFWNEDSCVAALTYYATHPQSYYRTGKANPDLPGLARNARQDATKIPHFHFNGAGGNIGAGKWNDGSPENRPVLMERVADGMKRAFESTKRTPLDPKDVAWATVTVHLPPASYLDHDAVRKTLYDADARADDRYRAARELAWMNRVKARDGIELSSLRLGNARVLHMPGELFVEYQLKAAKMRPDLFVAMAAYGDYAPGYIGTDVAYSQGGYETSPGVSRVGPPVEQVLTDGMKKLFQATDSK